MYSAAGLVEFVGETLAPKLANVIDDERSATVIDTARFAVAMAIGRYFDEIDQVDENSIFAELQSHTNDFMSRAYKQLRMDDYGTGIAEFSRSATESMRNSSYVLTESGR